MLDKDNAYYYPNEILNVFKVGAKSVGGSAFYFKSHFYYDNKLKKSFFKEGVTGEEFLVSSDCIADWRITKESKEILGFTCFKAVAYEKESRGKGRKGCLMKLEAWFAPKLPFSYGPKGVYGLPGLILELVDREIFIHKAQKIEIDPKGVEIKDQTSGETITKAKFNSIIYEMVKRAGRGRGRR